MIINLIPKTSTLHTKTVLHFAREEIWYTVRVKNSLDLFIYLSMPSVKRLIPNICLVSFQPDKYFMIIALIKYKLDLLWVCRIILFSLNISNNFTPGFVCSQPYGVQEYQTYRGPAVPIQVTPWSSEIHFFDPDKFTLGQCWIRTQGPLDLQSNTIPLGQRIMSTICCTWKFSTCQFSSYNHRKASCELDYLLVKVVVNVFYVKC